MSKITITFALLLAIAYSTEADEESPMFGSVLNPLDMIRQINSNMNQQMTVMMDPKNLQKPGVNGVISKSYIDSQGNRQGFIATSFDGKYEEMHTK